MVELIDFDSWTEYDGAAEGSGRSEKLWLKSDQGEIGLFKFPKIDPETNKETTEHISEHLAYKIGKILDVQTARVDVGTYQGRIGSMSYFLCGEREFLQEGIWLISGKYPHYNAEKLYDEKNNKFYCIDHLYNTIPANFSSKWVEMLLFDFLIGNSDRHQSNWALLIKVSTEALRIKWSPLYDNGSSLCAFVNDNQVSEFLGRDKNRFHALVDSRSRSIIRIDGSNKKTPPHKEMAKFLLAKFPVAKKISRNFIEKLTQDQIESLLDEYNDDILCKEKKELIHRFLNKKIEILNDLLREVELNGK